MKIGLRTTDRPDNRGGFTLVELLVAMTIFVILATMSIGAFRTNDEGRVSNASSSLRAALEGAKSRALKAQAPRGLRFYQSGGESDLDRRILTSMVYTDGGSFDSFEGQIVDLHIEMPSLPIPEPNRWAIRMISIPPDTLTEEEKNELYLNEVDQLKRLQQLNISGLLKDMARTEILTDKGNWYTSTLPMDNVPQRFPYNGTGEAHNPDSGFNENFKFLFLNGTGSYTHNSLLKFRIQLAPAVLPGAEVVQFPRNTCIDLDGSKIPLGWFNSGQYGTINGYFDIIFTPKGTVDRRSVNEANVIFRVASIQDLMDSEVNGVPLRTSSNLSVVVKNPQRGARLVMLTTQTGFLFNTQLYPPTYQLDPDQYNTEYYGQSDDPDTHGVDPNPFKYAYDGKGAR